MFEIDEINNVSDEEKDTIDCCISDKEDVEIDNISYEENTYNIDILSIIETLSSKEYRKYKYIDCSIFKIIIASLASLLLFGELFSLITFILMFYNETIHLELNLPWIVFKKLDEDGKNRIIFDIKEKYKIENIDDIIKNNQIMNELIDSLQY